MPERDSLLDPTEEAFLQSMREDQDQPMLRLAFADWLEEKGDSRGELLRLTHQLTQPFPVPDRVAVEHKVRALLEAGVRSVGPAWVNSLGMKMTWIPPGSFLMGSDPNEDGHQDDEILHNVTLTKGFYLGVYPVTQAQWQSVMGTNPSRFRGDDRPVEGVSWEDCQLFCQKLTLMDGLGDEQPYPYRLPTEAEWEYSCRAGTRSPFFFGETMSSLQANFHPGEGVLPNRGEVARQESTSAGQFHPNAFGLFDLHGNVFEWCADWYGPYPEHAVINPMGKPEGDVRVLRGGSWHSLMRRCRSACRGWGPPGYRGSDVGVRILFRLEFDYRL